MKIMLGNLIAVVILILISIAPSINANVNKTTSDIIFDENFTPITLVFQLITKLRNHPNIQNVETEYDVLQIIESDAELNDIFVKLKSNDCGCEDDSSNFPLRFPLFCYGFELSMVIVWCFFGFNIIFFIMNLNFNIICP